MTSSQKPLPAAPSIERVDKRSGRIEYQDLPAVIVLLRSWKQIATLTIAAVIISVIFAKFVMTQWYRAQAILLPVSQLMPNGLGSTATSSLTSSLLGTTLGSSRGEEILTTLESFDFSLAMVDRHSLQHELLFTAGFWGSGSDPRWQIFRLLQKRLSCDFSVTTGNATLSYLDPHRATAERILNYYIDDLRQKLREEQIRNTGAAIRSLQEEAKSTPDSLLQAQLYMMVAQQLEEQKLAMVEADFAFKVLQRPAASDRPYSPNPILVAGLVGIVVLFLSCFALLSLDWLRHIRSIYELDLASSARKREAGPAR